jgi:hypothetical protein
MKQLCCLLILMLAVLLPLQSDAAMLGVGPRVGIQKTQDSDNAKVFGGIGARLKFFAIGVEGAVDYRSEKYSDGAITMHSYPVTASALFYPLPIVYGLAGMGWYNTSIEFKSSAHKTETDQQVGYHIGAGVEIPLGKMTLAGDVRYVFIGSIPAAGGDVKADYYAITLSALFKLF